jgi:hypothetical protein
MNKLTGLAVVGAVLGSFLLTSAAYAATPSLSAFYTNSGDNVTVNVSNADANASVLLDNLSTSALQSIGTTNSNGALSITLSTASYNITPAGSVYVTVDGQVSNSIAWPYTSSSNSSFSLNQTNLSLTVGQSSVITASTGGPFFLSNNSNPSVANVAFSGSQITVTANIAGTTNLTICLVSSTGICETATVNVSASGSSAITFSQNGLTIPTGATATVTVSGGTGVYSVTNNSNSSVVSASISNNVVSLYASNAVGTSAITICSSNLSSCGVITLTVSSNSSNSTLIFSNATPSLLVGQSMTVSIVGGVTPYYISSNSNSSVVSTSVSGNIITFSGMEAGSASVTVCSETNVCQTLPVTVGSTSSGSLTLGQTNVTVAPGQSDTVTLSGGSGTYYISSNSNSNVASAAVSGANVTISGISAGTNNVSVCSSNGLCSTIYITVSGSATTVTNTGSSLTLTQVLSVGQGVNILLSGGTSPYSITSGKSSAFSAAIYSGNVLTLVGLSAGNSSVTVCSSNSICMPVYVDVTSTAAAVSGSTSASASQYNFTTLLTYGSTGSAVTALQEQLTRDGIYTGSITGYYGDLTTAAVKAFQSKHGISSAGYVGPSTRAALNAGN